MGIPTVGCRTLCWLLLLLLLVGCDENKLVRGWGWALPNASTNSSANETTLAKTLPSFGSKKQPTSLTSFWGMKSDRDQTGTSGQDVNVFAAQRDENAKRSDKRPRPQLLETQFDIMHIMVPLGTISGSRELWNQVNEQVLPAVRVQQLRNNGVRAGLVSEASWAGFKETLDELSDRRINWKRLVFRNGYPLELSIDERPRLNTVFYYLPDGRMPGNSYADSKRYLHVAHTPNPENFNEVLLAITPEIRQGRARKKWEMTEDGIRRVSLYEGKVFVELSILVTVPAGSVLVIGMSPEVGKPNIFGEAFLTDEQDGQRWETMYLIAPRILRMPIAKR